MRGPWRDRAAVQSCPLERAPSRAGRSSGQRCSRRRTAPPRTGRRRSSARLAGSGTADVPIIGGGVIGLLTAREKRLAGAGVSIPDAGQLQIFCFSANVPA